MKPARQLMSNNVGNNDKKSVGASVKSSNISGGVRYGRLNLNVESVGCLSLLDAGEKVERPRAFPSPGLAGEILPSCGLKVHAQPTIPLHRPRAVLSSPENDELQGPQREKSTISYNALKSLEAHSKDLPVAFLSSDTFNDSASLSKEAPKAVVSPPDELLYVGGRERSISDEASSCSTSSNRESNTESLLAYKPLDELVSVKLSRILTAEALKEKKGNIGVPPISRLEQSSNEEYLANSKEVLTPNRLIKRYSSVLTTTPRRSPKQSSTPRSAAVAAKGNAGRVLRPWY